MIKSYGELDDRQIDILREIGNVGAGNAATSLSALLGEGVNISVPQAMILDFDSIIRMIGAPEDDVIAIMIRFSGDVCGAVLFLLGVDDAKCIAALLVGDFEHEEHREALSEMKLSAVKEIGNILGSSYLGSIAALAGYKLDISVPFVSIDMVGAIMNVPMLEFSVDSNRIFLVEDRFSIGERHLSSHVILFTDIPSLNKLLEKLGIEE